MQKADIIAQLQRDILPLQGYKSSLHSEYLDVGLGPIKHAFPSSVFPLGAVHEFFCHRAEEAAASSGFIAGILSSLMQGDGAALWIGSSATIFPPALKLLVLIRIKLFSLRRKARNDLFGQQKKL
jgi:protein ImuA